MKKICYGNMVIDPTGPVLRLSMNTPMPQWTFTYAEIDGLCRLLQEAKSFNKRQTATTDYDPLEDL